MEQMLGHVTHHQNLARWAKEEPDIEPFWMPVQAEAPDLWEKAPIIRNNWSLKASLRARGLLDEAFAKRQFDALFLHTQTTALFAKKAMRKVPSIVSIDATPINYDSVGEAYGHFAGKINWLESRKYKWHRSTFENAAHIVSWCQWAKDSLIQDYGISPDKVTVIPPGVDRESWSFGSERKYREKTSKTRLLFVGGDFERKGGWTLVRAFQENLSNLCELDIVTKDEKIERELAGVAGIRVYRGLQANSSELKNLYAAADLFVFPTEADCLPVAVMEAMMAGLPVIATKVGALAEEVESGVSGLIVPLRNEQALAQAVTGLANNPEKRLAMSHAGREIAEKKFDARRNYGMIFDLLRGIVKES